MFIKPHLLLSLIVGMGFPVGVGVETCGGARHPYAELVTEPEVQGDDGMPAPMTRRNAEATGEAIAADFERHRIPLTQDLAKIDRLMARSDWHAAEAKAPLAHAAIEQLMDGPLRDAPAVATLSATLDRQLTALATHRRTETAGRTERGVTLRTYQQLRYGMSFRDVTAMLGRDGVERSHRGGFYLMAWEGVSDARHRGGIMMLTFQESLGHLELVAKTQLGLD